MENLAVAEVEPVPQYSPDRLPNGLIDSSGSWINTFELREMDGIDEDIIVNRRHARDGKTIGLVLENCITRLGPCTDPTELKKLVPQLTMEDATFLVVRLRQLSLGDEYVYEATCPQGLCQGEGKFEINLAERKVTFRDDPPKDRYMITVGGVDGQEHVVEFRQLRLKDNTKLVALSREYGDKLLSMQIFLHIVSVDETKITNYVDVMRWKMRSRESIRKAINEQTQYGLDVEVLNTCPKCGTEYYTTLAVGSERFFFPSGVPRHF